MSEYDNSDKIGVGIICDCDIARIGLKESIDGYNDKIFVSYTSDASDFIEKHDTDTDVVIVHVSDSHGMLCRRILEIDVYARIIIITSDIHDDTIMDFLNTGVSGCVDSGISVHNLALAIMSVNEGFSFIKIPLARKLFSIAGDFAVRSGRSALSSLTRQEKNALIHLLDGKTNKEIADEIGVKEGVARNYLSQAYRKLKVNNRVEAAAYIEKFKLIDIISEVHDK